MEGSNRWDETWHRLREWTAGQAPSERLSAQILSNEGFADIDPSHPLGGKDGGKDAICTKDGLRWVMAVYFPRGQQDFKTIETKFSEDLAGALKNSASGFAFVTNQELRLAERRELSKLVGDDVASEIFHLERITNILDKPAMAQVRAQFLSIRPEANSVLYKKRAEAIDVLWEALINFLDNKPKILAILDLISINEERRLNRMPQFQHVLDELNDLSLVEWAKHGKKAERVRHLIADPVWDTYFDGKAIIGRIAVFIRFERNKSPMRSWREDSLARELLDRVCTKEESNRILSLKSGVIIELENLIKTKLRGAIQKSLAT